MKRVPALLSCGCVALAVWCSAASSATAADSADLRKIFAAPPRAYASAPLWVWNDMLTESQIVSSLEDLAQQQVKQVFVHPRPGLMTPYLSDDWFRLWKVALREAERLDMNIWIYDENSYPSGFAGGWVPEVMPDSRGRGLDFRDEKLPNKPGPDVVAVYRKIDNKFTNVTVQARAGELTEGSYLVAFVRRAADSPWHGDRCYVDLLKPGVTEKFLDITLGAYQKQVGDQFGKRIPGCFTDEPNIRPAGGMPWTEHLPDEFQKRWGYSLLDHLPSLTRPVGDWKRVRHNYFQVLVEQFIEHWGKPYYERCAKLGLDFTGHYWDHEWPNCLGVPDNMAMSAWQQLPGIDCLMNQYREDTHAQFGNVRMVKELSSLANQLGRKRTLCEIYGAGGWDLRFEDMKRIGDWLEVLGVNLLDEHLSYITLRGARKADHPQSFSYHEPWWEAYHVMASYFTRVSAALSHGEQINRTLVLEPTSTAWMYQADPSHAAKQAEVGKSFFDLLILLERAQVEYDIGCEDVMARHGSVEAENDGGWSKLVVGQRKYWDVVLPPNTETVNAKTLDLLETFAKAGGRIWCCGPAPTLVDGAASERVAALIKCKGWAQVEPGQLPEKLFAPVRLPDSTTVPAICRSMTIIKRNPDDAGNLFHHRRAFKDGDLMFLVNTSLEAPSGGVIRSLRQGVERWDLETGQITPYPFQKAQKNAGSVEVPFTLPPGGSLMLFFTTSAVKAQAAAAPKVTPVAATGPVQVQRVGPNVLTVDCLDVTAGGETKLSTYFHKANQFAFVKNGMPRNPWDSAVQFKEELISKKFPADSGFTATYHFTIAGAVPKPLEIVIERTDLYTITCNGQPVTATKDAWWLDRAFGRIDISALAKTGDNQVTLVAKPMTIYHELEPAYVLGDFSLKAVEAGFAIEPPQPLTVDRRGWNEQGHPFLSAGVSYRQSFNVTQPAGRYRVTLPAWYGSVAKVAVNGKPAGYIAHQPWECEVTSLIQPGANAIEVTVIGTLKNTLGPHHAGPGVGSAWPGMFHQGPAAGPPPGAKYHTLGYGLFEPFTLQALAP